MRGDGTDVPPSTEIDLTRPVIDHGQEWTATVQLEPWISPVDCRWNRPLEILVSVFLRSFSFNFMSCIILLNALLVYSNRHIHHFDS